MQSSLDKLCVESLGFFCGSLIDAPDNAVVVHQFVNNVAGQDAFRTVCYVYLAFEFGSLGKDDFGHSLGGAYGRSGLDDKEVAFFEAWNDGASGGFDIAYIGLVVAFEGRGHYDEKCIGGFGSGLCMQASVCYDIAQQVTQSRFDDVKMSGVCLCDNVGVDVHADDVDAVFGGNDSGGQSDVAQSHEAGFHKMLCFVLYIRYYAAWQCRLRQVIGYATLGAFARACLVWCKGTNFIWIKELEMTGYNLICNTALRICKMSL